MQPSRPPRRLHPPGRIEEKDGHRFQQHWLPGMRGRIVVDPCHRDRIGREVVASGDHVLDHDFGPSFEIDGVRTHYWWGHVEVIE